MAARGFFANPSGRGALVAPPARISGDMSGDDLRAARSGLLTLGEVETIAAVEAAAAVADERRRAARLLGQTSGRRAAEDAATEAEATATGAALARARALNEAAAAAVEAARAEVEADGGALTAAGALGAGVVDVEGGERDKARRIIAAETVKADKRAIGERAARIIAAADDGASVAPLAMAGARRRVAAAGVAAEVAAENARAAGAGLLSAYEWALLTLSAVAARQVRARAAALLRDGARGKILARGMNLAASKAARWMRSNSRREACNLDEVGAAGGVDDRQAWTDWTAELLGVSRGVYVTCAAIGAAIVKHSLPACHPFILAGLGIERRDWSAAVVRMDENGEWEARAPIIDGAAEFRAAIVGRGHRDKRRSWTDGQAVLPSAEALAEGTRGGIAWRWAARVSGRELHSARYGRGGRDGREVAACWSANGTIKGGDLGVVHIEGGAVWRAPVARRASFARDLRGALAVDLRARRAAVGIARALVDLAADMEERARRGSALGVALCALATSKRRAATLRAALAGEAIGEGGAADMMENGALSGAGRKMAARFRAAFPALAVATGKGKRKGQAGAAEDVRAARDEAAAVAAAAAVHNEIQAARRAAADESSERRAAARDRKRALLAKSGGMIHRGASGAWIINA